MAGSTARRAHGRRGDTRRRIQDVALELFVEQGYEKTSLREIAERLEVTKAALYHHFKTKEDIIVSVFADLTRPVDELIAWAREQPPTLDTKREVLRRYSQSMSAGASLFRFMQENQATMRELSIGGAMQSRTLQLVELLRTEGGPLTDQVRCVSALFTLHAGVLYLRHVEGDPEETRRAALESATDLLIRAHRG